MKKLFLAIALIFCLGTAVGTPAYARIVSYNTGTGVWHNASCQHSQCKKCIKIEESDARQRGGRPCKRCGG